MASSVLVKVVSSLDKKGDRERKNDFLRRRETTTATTGMTTTATTTTAMASLDEQKAANVDDELLEDLPELDPVCSFAGHRRGPVQLVERVDESLAVRRVRLRVDQKPDQLAESVLQMEQK